MWPSLSSALSLKITEGSIPGPCLLGISDAKANWTSSLSFSNLNLSPMTAAEFNL